MFSLHIYEVKDIVYQFTNSSCQINYYNSEEDILSLLNSLPFLCTFVFVLLFISHVFIVFFDLTSIRAFAPDPRSKADSKINAWSTENLADMSKEDTGEDNCCFWLDSQSLYICVYY